MSDWGRPPHVGEIGSFYSSKVLCFLKCSESSFSCPSLRLSFLISKMGIIITVAFALKVVRIHKLIQDLRTELSTQQ